MGGIAHAAAATVPITSESRPGVDHLIEPRKVGRSDLDTTLYLQADQDPIERNPAHERLGPVDRIHDPAVARLRKVLAVLLTDDAVIGKGSFEPLPNQRFGLAIGDRDRGVVRLEFGGDFGLKVP